MSVQGFLNQTVEIALKTGHDGYGRPSFGDAVAYPARIEQRVKMVRDLRGEEKMSTGRVYLSPSVEISPEDRITLPDESSPEILHVGTGVDGRGNTVYKVVLI